MKRTSLSIGTAAGMALLLGFAWLNKRPPEMIEVRNPCNTFVSEFSPKQTPELRSTDDGLRLVVSFTPAKDEEAERIIGGVQAGSKKLLLPASKDVLETVGIEDYHLVLAVKSADDANDVLKLLCFEHLSLKREAP